ncbi:MAG: NDP-sugar synthase, partial [Promethearchaeota archaeon]
MDTKSKFYVIILAAGYGTRLKPLSNRIPKPLIDINGKTLISRVISNFEDAGFNKFCVVVGYKKSLIREELNKYDNLDILIVEQTDPSGMADAINLAIKRINQKNDQEKNFNFFITAADIIFPKEDILKIYNLFEKSKSEMVLSLMKSKDLRIAEGHGNVKIDDESNLSMDTDINNGLRIVDIIEKPQPQQILSEYYSLPLYLVNQHIINYLESIKL